MLALCVIQPHSFQMQDIFKSNILWEDQVQTLDTLYKLGKCSLCTNPNPQAQSQMTRVEAEIQLPAHSRGQWPWHSA